MDLEYRGTTSAEGAIGATSITLTGPTSHNVAMGMTVSTPIPQGTTAVAGTTALWTVTTGLQWCSSAVDLAMDLGHGAEYGDGTESLPYYCPYTDPTFTTDAQRANECKEACDSNSACSAFDLKQPSGDFFCCFRTGAIVNKPTGGTVVCYEHAGKTVVLSAPTTAAIPSGTPLVFEDSTGTTTTYTAATSSTTAQGATTLSLTAGYNIAAGQTIAGGIAAGTTVTGHTKAVWTVTENIQHCIADPSVALAMGNVWGYGTAFNECPYVAAASVEDEVAMCQSACEAREGCYGFDYRLNYVSSAGNVACCFRGGGPLVTKPAGTNTCYELTGKTVTLTPPLTEALPAGSNLVFKSVDAPIAYQLVMNDKR